MIIVTGLPLFAKRLAEDLAAVDPSTRYVALDTYSSLKDKLRFLLLLPFADAVISMNGVTDQSGSLDWVLRLKKKLILQWMGTDILLAQKRSVSGEILRKYVDYGKNFCDSPWMKEELKQSGINAEILHFKYVEPKLDPVEKYEDIRVLSYVAKNRETFYGLEHIIKLAALNPEIYFEVIGTDASQYELPPNVNALSWVESKEVAEKMSKSAVFLRLTEHDGFSASVTEALSYGAEVLWTFPFPPSIEVRNLKDLETIFAETIKAVKIRGNIPNVQNAEFVRNAYKRSEILENYLRTIKS